MVLMFVVLEVLLFSVMISGWLVVVFSVGLLVFGVFSIVRLCRLCWWCSCWCWDCVSGVVFLDRCCMIWLCRFLGSGWLFSVVRCWGWFSMLI